MKLKVKLLDIEAVKPIVVLNEEDAKEIGCYTSDRIKISLNGKTATAIMNTTETSVAEGEIGIFDEFWNLLKINFIKIENWIYDSCNIHDCAIDFRSI